jgi:hypothetical protein
MASASFPVSASNIEFKREICAGINPSRRSFRSKKHAEWFPILEVRS